MKVYVFKCKSKPRVGGMTQDPAGVNLPPLPNGDAWQHWKTIDISAGEKNRIGLDVEKLLQALASDGFYLAEYAIHITESVVPNPPAPVKATK